MNKLRNAFTIPKITVPRIAILGLLLSLLIALKYVFGFILGIEFISFTFILLGIFLPSFDLLLLITCFNFLIVIVYGFGSWWLMYWIIWPVDAFVSKIISKFTKNKYVFATWGFVAGALVFFWYFISDVIFFGGNYALLNVVTAIPVNTIEGLTTMMSIIVIGPLLAHVFNQYGGTFWNKSKPWKFKEHKNETISKTITLILVLLSLAGIVLMFVYNGWFIELKQSLSIIGGDNGRV